jgi:hypothetical protein
LLGSNIPCWLAFLGIIVDMACTAMSAGEASLVLAALGWPMLRHKSSPKWHYALLVYMFVQTLTTIVFVLCTYHQQLPMQIGLPCIVLIQCCWNLAANVYQHQPERGVHA